jgi:hypothetical protein
MSRAALLAAATAPQVFDPTPPPDTLGACLAPYESLIDDCHLESDLHTRLHAYARIALVGPRGCGKTSVARYALDADDVAMILINVVTEEQRKTSRPSAAFCESSSANSSTVLRPPARSRGPSARSCSRPRSRRSRLTAS